MSSAAPFQQGDMVVVNQMYPSLPQGGSVGNYHMIGLGAVQIMIGLTVLSFGLVPLFSAITISVFSGVYAWGCLFYIIAGSLTVAAGKSTNRCLMGTTVGFNIFASLAALSGSALYAVDAVVPDLLSYEGYDWLFESALVGTFSALTAFHILEFIIAIASASLACRCCKQQQRQQLPGYIIPGKASMVPQAPPSYQPESANIYQLPLQGLPTYRSPVSTSMAHPPSMTGVPFRQMDRLYQDI